ncbi:feline leukemia virus subgroup C receptor-related protein 2-like isoform X2 [Dinothrombium tinctorium]|uniref:Feline leukemia virus subgroup C receptor-related protein 2-like isoform X2 n=1 Tax=Dinothrombium tinctorium TaxID=1965070 RepID=A0A3S3NWX8_9ACAR|nr:feline leukemia virus subgroup C receptor-related protein 2-like isoform X2 [Dinothrombium tinctorium]RWS10525.1 feline leukemia virus subgroup C receptor-related protein 2-like isoform X2 [Dinothrombium tinctorium]RWS10682.1 feline leukemia virus subgroup C receptor-related protein 2-like isoform X2 [Dinothrombium tinctorium]RWS10711.1 feline leukemia virus subgroup C receptor-related protein 2-like isoform X2 [Dinothrombium tinctorium]
MKMTENESVNGANQTFVYYKRRYLLALLLGLYTATNFFQHFQYATISNVVSDYYGVSEQAVNWNALVYNVGATVFIYPIMKCIEKFGFSNSMVIGTAMNAFGTAIKLCAIKQNRFDLLLIGQLFPAFGCLFPFSLPPILGTNWFKSEHVAGVIGFNFALNAIGTASAFVMPSLIFNNLNNKTEIASALSSVSYTIAVIAFGVFVMTVLFVKEKPRTPPSLAEQSRIQNNIRLPLSSLWQNRNFILLVIIYSLVTALGQAVTIVLNQMVFKQFAKSIANRIVTIAGLLALLSEIPSTAIISMICARYNQYKIVLISYCVLLIVFLSVYTFGFYISNEIMIYIFIFLSGFTYNAMFVILSDFIIEATYPISEGATLNIAVCISGIPGLFLVPLMSALIKQFGSASANITLLVIAALQLVLSLGVSNDLKRHRVNLSGPSASQTKMAKDDLSETNSEQTPLIS